MKDATLTDPPRLRDKPAGNSGESPAIEARATALLRHLTPARAPSPSSLARVRAGLEDATAPRPRRSVLQMALLFLLVPLAAATAVAAWNRLGSRRGLGASVAPTEQVHPSAAPAAAPPSLVEQHLAPAPVPTVSPVARPLGAGSSRLKAKHLVQPKPVPQRSVAASGQAGYHSWQPSGVDAFAPPDPSPALEPDPIPTLRPQQHTSRLDEEARQLGLALAELNHAHRPAAALGLLEAYWQSFPNGALASEAGIAEIEANLALGNDDKALARLQRLEASGAPLPRSRLDVLRAELLARRGSIREALGLFIGQEGAGEPIAERARYGAATCQLRLGELKAARLGLQQYLRDYPNGRFADRARRQLQKIEAPAPP